MNKFDWKNVRMLLNLASLQNVPATRARPANIGKIE
jgi:hypothetical protein